MKKNLFLLAILLTTIFTGAAEAAETIILTLPQSVVADTLAKALPIQIDETSDALAGSIALKRIDNLAFNDQGLSGKVSLSGRDMKLSTSLGSQKINVNVGNVDLSFSVSAKTRYDRKTETLLIHPVVTDINEQGGQNGEIGTLIVALFNDQDIPVKLDRLQPIIADIGGKKLVIETRVENVIFKPGKLQIDLLPKTSVKK